ncbi:hypothetical protein EV702DRAFT_1055550 [Suillus placidus]|uniref:Uncharacterized protein n=1 Tax=Suillus placidus TaxID=48579 RepID=A0A9P7D9B3_9AGAM|nr:hypothetical protein EV702DRAFT_1055550 [Suillus placidus]
MPTSEIDDIFAAKGKAKAIELAPLQSVKKEKKKKRKDRPSSDESKEISRSSDSKTLKKRQLPETVVDPSFKSSSSSKRAKLDAPVSSQHEKIYHEDEDRFKDSRGSGPRRKTDDGFNIYKEDELGISNAGGGTLRTYSHQHSTFTRAQTHRCVLSIANVVCICLFYFFVVLKLSRFLNGSCSICSFTCKKITVYSP